MDYVTLAALAAEFGLDRSNTRKYVLKHGFEPITVRTPESRGQLSLALKTEDAEVIRALRQSQGFGSGRVPSQQDASVGAFYLVQLVPDLAPNRVKLGFATDAVARLTSHRTAAPTAQLVKTWPCRFAWEPCAIVSATRTGCRQIGGEVYECDSMDELVIRLDAFFFIMPGI